MAKVVISTGHYGKGMCLPGAVGNGYKEAAEAEKIVERVAKILGKDAIAYTDTVSTNQRSNLNNIVAYHNSKARVMDVSIHFNSGGGTGVEVLYYSWKKTAAQWSKEIAKVLGLKDRGGKHRPELAFLRGSNKPALLIETCFIDSASDMASYKKNFEALCQTIAKLIAKEVGIKLDLSQEKENNVSNSGTTSAHVDEVYHKVQKGETLYKIAVEHGTTVEKLKKLNKLTSNIIQPDQKLRVK